MVITKFVVTNSTSHLFVYVTSVSYTTPVPPIFRFRFKCIKKTQQEYKEDKDDKTSNRQCFVVGSLSVSLLQVYKLLFKYTRVPTTLTGVLIVSFSF